MLKKIVKYGNSNALILDKAILELLNIEENSLVKIKTDGKSLIITPHIQTPAAQEKVSETFTSADATHDLMVNSYINQYEKADEAHKDTVIKELKELLAQELQLNKKLFLNPELAPRIQEELKQLPQNTSLYEHKDAYNQVKAKYSSEQAEWNNAFKEWERRNNLVLKEAFTKKRTPSPTAVNELNKAAEEMAKKYNLTSMNLDDNPQYQHELQLIAEKYQGNKDLAAYVHEVQELTYKYKPELKQFNAELEEALKKHKK